MPEFVLFGYHLNTYWFMFALAAVFSLGLSVYRARWYTISAGKAVLITALFVLYGYAGAKLLYMIETPSASLSLTGGMSFFGSVYFIPAAMFLTVCVLRVGYGAAMDFITPYVPLILAFLRVGCHFNGCCAGRPITAFGITFIPPVQLMECGLDVLICLLLFSLAWRKKWTGLRYPIFMVSYSVVRLLMEPMRNTPKELFFLSRGQWLSILSLLIGGGLLLAGRHRRTAA